MPFASGLIMTAGTAWAEVDVSEQNGDGHKTATVLPPAGKPFAQGHDPRRNAGGRPKGLAAVARVAVADDGHDLIEFFSAVMRGDGKALGSAWLRRTARYT